MSSQEELRELKNLIASNQKVFEKSTLGVKQALETVELNNQWKVNEFKDVSKRLNRMMLRNFGYSLDEEDDEEKPQTSSIWYFVFVPRVRDVFPEIFFNFYVNCVR